MTPPHIVAVLTLPHGMELGDVGARLDGIAPGSGMMAGMGLGQAISHVAAQLVANPDAVRRREAVHVLLLDHPAKPLAFGLVATFEGEPAPVGEQVASRRSGGMTLVAPAAAMDSIAPYALWLAEADSGDEPRLRLVPKSIATVFGEDIAKFREEMSGLGRSVGSDLDVSSIFELYAVMGRALVEQSPWIDVYLRAGEAPLLEIIAATKPESTFAKFAALQTPHVFALSRKLPAASRLSLYLEGRTMLGELLEPMLDLAKAFMPAAASEDYREGMRKLASVMTGEFAGFMEMREGGFVRLDGSAPQYDMYFVAPTNASADDGIRQMWRGWEAGGPATVMGIEQRATFERDLARVGDAAVHQVIIESKLPSVGGGAPVEMIQKMQFAGLSNWLLTAQSVGGSVSLEPAYRALQGDGEHVKLPEPVTGALARAENQQASFAMVMVLENMLPAEARVPFSVVSMTMGVAGADSDSPRVSIGVDMR